MPRRPSTVLAFVVLAGSLSAPLHAVATPPSVVFILLDTTRADRFGVAGGRADTTPVLDALAHRGIRFTRHFANSHATRPSMPQLMSGRYYRDNILARFRPDADPREMTFARPDPSAVLLPRLMHEAGYATTGISAHPWVAPDSELGRAFDHFELVPFGPHEAHGDATTVVDRALALWAARDRGRPSLLYLHFMDMHIPRRLRDGKPLHPVEGYDWQTRFRPNGEPLFDRARRRWSRYDASDFTPADRAHYAAVYDTQLRHADSEIGRLLEALERDDPGLGRTVIVVTADHGEELGEDGRIEHPPALADGVQHVPWIVAGGPVAPGQLCDAVTEHVDVLPSLGGLLGIAAPPESVFDGASRLDGGRLRSPCGGRQAYYVWEDYRGVRIGHYLLVEHPADGLEARCSSARTMYRIDHLRRRVVDAPGSARRRDRMAKLLEDRLGPRERAYRARRYGSPTAPFLVRSGYWRLANADHVRCVTPGEATPRRDLLAPGWFATGRGLALTAGSPAPVTIRLDAPPGHYAVEAATTAIPRAPWLFGVSRWRRRAFGQDEPREFVPLSPIDATAGEAVVALPPTLLTGNHVLGIRLVPPGSATVAPGVDREREDRLRALGYVQ